MFQLPKSAAIAGFWEHYTNKHQCYWQKVLELVFVNKLPKKKLLKEDS